MNKRSALIGSLGSSAIFAGLCVVAYRTEYTWLAWIAIVGLLLSLFWFLVTVPKPRTASGSTTGPVAYWAIGGGSDGGGGGGDGGGC